MDEEREVEKHPIELIQLLKLVEGAINYDGDYSTQVYVPLRDGRHLRIGIGDDVESKLTFDFYEGLKIKGAKLFNQKK